VLQSVHPESVIAIDMSLYGYVAFAKSFRIGGTR